MYATNLKKRLSFVDALRGVAALGVVLFHATEANHIAALQAAMPGWLVSIVEHSLFSLLASVIVKDRQVETFSVGQIVAHLFYAQDRWDIKI
jgi:uncharacterized membrane protein YeiB